MRRPSKSLEREFAEHLSAANKEAARLGYCSQEFDSMLKIHGGVSTATRLLRSADIQTGLYRLCAMGRPDLTLEAIVLLPKYRDLFAQQHLDAASWRLKQVSG